MTEKNRLRELMVCLALGLGILAIYFPVFGYSWSMMDDQLYVLNNPHVNKGLAGVWGWAFQTGFANVWQPLTWISHALDCQIYNLKPGGPHATNLILHILNSSLVFLVLRRLTGAFWRSAAVAAFFAFHPLHVESVAWIAERKGLLCAFFWLLTLWAYLGYTESRKSNLPNYKWFYTAALGLFAMALMSKPVAVTLPCMLLLMDWWPLGRVVATPERTVGKQALALLVEKIPFFVFSIVSSVKTIQAIQTDKLLDPVSRLPMKVRFVTAGMSYFRYLAKTFWPSDLGALYPFSKDVPKPELIGVGLLLIGITVMAVRARKTRPYWLFGWLWFLVILFPAMNLLQAGSEPMADRYMYIPSIGLWLLICWEACDLAGPFKNGQAILCGLCGLLLAACGVASHMQLGIWRNEETLLSRVAVSNSNATAHANYAAYLMRHGRLAEAETEGQMAVAISTKFAPLSVLLGEILLREQKYDPAMDQFHRALRLDPGLFAIHMQLGRALLGKQQPGLAEDEFREVLLHAPRDYEAHSGVATALVARKKTAEAAAEFQLSLQGNPNQPEILNDLAWILATDPSPQVRNGANAVKLASRACSLTKGQSPMMLTTLGAAYAETGDFGNAIKAAEAARDEALKLAKQAGQVATTNATQKTFDEAFAKEMTLVAQRNAELLKLYQAHKPARE